MDLSLPIEVLGMVFNHLNPHEICNIETVCQTWFSISRSSPYIWRDASRIVGNNAPNSVSLKRKIDNILLRSGGKLDSLAIRISGSTKAEANASRQILRILAPTGVKHLWTNCGTRWYCHSKEGKACTFLSSFSKAVRSPADSAISDCDKLRSLHIVTPQGTSSLKVRKGSPFTKCRLNLLVLLSDSVETFFNDGDIFQSLRQANNIQIRSPNSDWCIGGVSTHMAWQMVLVCHETVERAEIEIRTTDKRKTTEAITGTRCYSIAGKKKFYAFLVSNHSSSFFVNQTAALQMR